MPSSLELALADIEMLQAAYPDEVHQVHHHQDTTAPDTLTAAFPIQCLVYLDSIEEQQQHHHQQQRKQQQVSQVTLEWNEGYPVTSGIQVASYRFASSSSSKARMDALLAAIKQVSEQCQQEEMESGLACVAAALRAWNDFDGGNDDNGTTAHHGNSNEWNDNDEQQQQHQTTLPSKLSHPSSTTLQQSPSYFWISGQPLIDRKSAFQAHGCRVESEQQVHQALEQLLTSHSKLQRATHNMVSAFFYLLFLHGLLAAH
jgi:hypothetical protein